MGKRVIVDGYNVIRQVARYIEPASKDLEMARVRLIEDLISWRAMSGGDAIVVFDGSSRFEAQGEKEVHGVTVMFSRKGETADTVIERLSREMAGKGGDNVHVVTSDYATQKTVFRTGVLRMTPGELDEELRETKERLAPRPGGRHFLEDRLDKEVRDALNSLRMG